MSWPGTSVKAASASMTTEQRRLLTYHDAYAYFAKHYGWDVIGQHMIDTYLSVATGPSRGLAIAPGAIRADPGYSS